MNKKRIVAAAAVVALVAVVAFAASRPAPSKNSGILSSVRKDIVHVLGGWQRKTIGFVNRMVRMYEQSPYSRKNFKKATDEMGDASRIK